ncbi:MAG: topoisomerase DNA-binding C4 zinc finger domain-containing protein [Myxococcaceae bacterium]|nr:topoisomerase DNA-binding C4 zinc finger domain-containing protein [Myxococcaceae bacterium]
METLEGRFGAYSRCLAAGCGGRVDAAVTTDFRCPLCAKALKDKGAFLGCEAYPTCRFLVDKKAWAKALKKGRACPRCQRPLIEKKGPRGKFLGCAAYPTCRHTEDVSR